MLPQIQNEIKAPKGQLNKFGNYRYRSCEDIVEAAKPVLLKHGYALTLTDEIVNIGGRFYVKATATILNNEGLMFSATAFAREEETKKGMDVAQITGSASSYARKYALNGLFAIDDTKDADATNTHGQMTGKQIEEDNGGLTYEQLDELHRLLGSSSYDEKQRVGLKARIDGYTTEEEFNKAKTNLLANQVGIDATINPSAKQINNQVKKIAKQPAA